MPRIGIGTGIGKSMGVAEMAFSNTFSTVFDGVDEFAETSGDVPALNSVTKMTWTMWFKYVTITVNDSLMAKWDFQTQGSWAITTSTTTPEIRVLIAENIASGGAAHLDTTDANLVSGTWHNLIVVYDGIQALSPDRVEVYIDSILKSKITAAAFPTSLTNGNASVKVAKFGGVLDRNVNSNIDEIGIFPNAAFNQAQVNEIYNSGDPLNLLTHSQAGNLNNYWRMGDGDTFPIITDKTGNDNLTMINMAADDFVQDTP